ncbi:GNAT family N-acetyltransferase [Ornithinimicrobium cerasi]|uniref:Ribosomal protein S18 acetylase RimI n=1 Tax=Ornithinimicrobium cerasi TaxID=2248773 RepID=A0A285VD66_9MICO|nr:GNAT family N-acetyltransferase [Ornithinimicrobium cerasi]SOC52024.1 Ribosomal protein S18 acetylase RimI [Ornithinimicrobium cerasi]
MSARRLPTLEGLSVRRLAPDDWRSYADLRIAMLTDAPDAFWTTLADVEARTEQDWRRSSNGSTLQARDGHGIPVGTLTLLTAATTPDLGVKPGPGDALVLAVYVVPAARGRGVVDALLDAALTLARDELGAWRMVLQVNEHNLGARRVYERHGYRLTGEFLQHPERPGVRDLEMVRPVGLPDDGS